MQQDGKNSRFSKQAAFDLYVTDEGSAGFHFFFFYVKTHDF